MGFHTAHWTNQWNSPATHIFCFDGMSDNRNHSPSNPSCLAPLSLVTRSRPLTQPLQSLYPVCMYSGKRHRWGRVMSFGLMPHRIHTNSSNRQTSFALFAFNEATHISRSVHYACTCRSDWVWAHQVNWITHWSDTRVGIHRYPRALNTGEHSNEQRATSNEPRATEWVYTNHERLDTQARLWVYDWYMKLSFFCPPQNNYVGIN